MGPISEQELLKVVKEKGIVTGADLTELLSGDFISLWHTCRKSANLCTRTVGRRYLRLDKQVEGYARLSPSIMREFLTYTLITEIGNESALDEKVRERENEIRNISRQKQELAFLALSEVVADMAEREAILESACCIIAGDIVYDMAHQAPRPERSTGRMVRGSDLDVVIITDDDLDPEAVRKFDRAVYERKYLLLAIPSYQEELDYLIKPVSRVKEQIGFDHFDRMVACKILHEGKFLLGSRALFGSIKKLLAEQDIPARLARLEQAARLRREEVESILLEKPELVHTPEMDQIFFYREEGEEIF